jgi:hypothetical protein
MIELDALLRLKSVCFWALANTPILTMFGAKQAKLAFCTSLHFVDWLFG